MPTSQVRNALPKAPISRQRKARSIQRNQERMKSLYSEGFQFTRDDDTRVPQEQLESKDFHDFIPDSISDMQINARTSISDILFG